MSSDELKKIIIQTAGLTVLILALLKVPNLITAVIGYLYFIVNSHDTSLYPELSKEWLQMKDIEFYKLMGGTISFLYLCILSWWLFRSPKLLQKLMKIKEENHNQKVN